MSAEFKGNSLYDYAAYITNVADFAIPAEGVSSIKAVKTAGSIITQLLSGIQDIYKIATTNRALPDSHIEVERLLDAIQGKCKRAMDLDLMLLHDVMSDYVAIALSDVPGTQQDDMLAIYRTVDYDTMDIHFSHCFINVESFLNNDFIMIDKNIVRGRVRPQDHVWLGYKYNDFNWKIARADEAISGDFYNFVRREHYNYIKFGPKSVLEEGPDDSEEV